MARGNSEIVGKKTLGGFLAIMLFAIIGMAIGIAVNDGKTGILMCITMGVGAAGGMVVAQARGIWPKKVRRAD